MAKSLDDVMADALASVEKIESERDSERQSERDKASSQTAPCAEDATQDAQRSAEDDGDVAVNISFEDGSSSLDEPGLAASHKPIQNPIQNPAPQMQEKADAEIRNLKEQLMRLAADFDNYRKRSLREKEEIRALANESLIGALLPVIDNLERALEHTGDDNKDPLVVGVRMVAKGFLAALGAQGAKPIAAVGEVFDPEVHEAVGRQDSEDAAAGVILLEVERGYRLGGRLLRAAKVMVSSGPKERPAEDGCVNIGADIEIDKTLEELLPTADADPGSGEVSDG